MNIQEALHQLLDGKDLSGDDMVIVMEQIMTGAVSNSMIVGFLVALRMKGGGDTTSTFNISTCSAIVAAAAGVKVAKHGARSVSSKSGAADLLEAAGVNIGLTAEQVKACIQELNLGFMFAPQHHSAMKHAIGPRRELGARTSLPKPGYVQLPMFYNSLAVSMSSWYMVTTAWTKSVSVVPPVWLN